jgi:hypothetical protein
VAWGDPRQVRQELDQLGSITAEDLRRVAEHALAPQGRAEIEVVTAEVPAPPAAPSKPTEKAP